MDSRNRSLAVVTGACAGTGRELAVCCAQAGYDVVITGDDPSIQVVADALKDVFGCRVDALLADLSAPGSIDHLFRIIDGRQVDALLVNAAGELATGYLDHDFGEVRHMLDSILAGPLHLVHRIGREMRARGSGRILLACPAPRSAAGTAQPAYDGARAFIGVFALALRGDLQSAGVTVTCLLPGRTEPSLLRRANIAGNGNGKIRKNDAAAIARSAFDAMQKGEAQTVAERPNGSAMAAMHYPHDEWHSEQGVMGRTTSQGTI